MWLAQCIKGVWIVAATQAACSLDIAEQCRAVQWVHYRNPSTIHFIQYIGAGVQARVPCVDEEQPGNNALAGRADELIYFSTLQPGWIDASQVSWS